MAHPQEDFSMSSVVGKLVLALVREGDYAHAGEEEAVDLALRAVAGPGGRRFLDVGCGIGGTARYVSDQGWGSVVGVDIDPANVELAQKRHPGLEFVCSDAAALEGRVRGRFDVVYCLNAFFLFRDQPAALKAMRAVASPGADLAIFDYIDPGGYAAWEPKRKRLGLRHPLSVEKLVPVLSESGWALERVVSMDGEYLRWYEALVRRIVTLRKDIVAASCNDFYEFVLSIYTEMRDDIECGRLGGATVYATAVG